jgi:predicted RNase H-like HicB family nuclease
MSKKFNLHILLYKEENYEIAHCLEFDIVTQGETKKEALQNLIDGIELQVNFAVENNSPEQLYNPAPLECWQNPQINFSEST